MTEDKRIRWHHRLSGHESEQALGDGEGQESLMCYSPWGHKESGMTNNNAKKLIFKIEVQLIYNVSGI